MKFALIISSLIFLAACQEVESPKGLIQPPSAQSDEDESADQQPAMDEAIQDEFRSQFTYQKVVDTFGNVAPFANIVQAEAQHVSELQALYQVRGLTPPASQWNSDNVPTYSSVQAACAAGVASETANIALYDRLLAQNLDSDVRAVFERLRTASQDQHLPAFQTCD